ncbi:probable proteasome inhibitor isoform X2 [Durio zibethinus]|uniref:Probable proteasome inhibitor isoform X2 n=1 Tax=Durio zibethinus TaxID=66656 RepID=A0A6P6AS11_DURZI|nr:probable proteasome inhibitor isoform X2 [Durio zibethinus]
MSNERSVIAVIRAARPSFRNDAERIAFAVHASFLSSGFVLTATGPDALADNVLSSPSTDEVGIDKWNEFEDHYAFVYINPEKGTNKVLIKCLVMNGQLLVDALAHGSSQPVHLEIDLETGEGSRRDVNDAGVRINEPTGPQPHPSGVFIPSINPIGGSDLFPGPGAGMYPTRGDFGGGGMLLGPNDPRWFGGVGGEHGFPGAQPGVPPGARFDPYGPPGVPGFEPNRFFRNPPRRPGGGTHPDLEHFGGGSDYI